MHTTTVSFEEDGLSKEVRVKSTSQDRDILVIEMYWNGELESQNAYTLVELTAIQAAFGRFLLPQKDAA
jgi:hypothetical protein